MQMYLGRLGVVSGVFRPFMSSYDITLSEVGLNSTFLLPALAHYIWPPPDIVKVLKASYMKGTQKLQINLCNQIKFVNRMIL